MQRYFDFYFDSAEDHSVESRKVVDMPSKSGGWDDYDIIPYKFPFKCDTFDSETFAWEITVGKDGSIRKPVKVLCKSGDYL